MPVKQSRGGSVRVDTDVRTHSTHSSEKNFSQAGTAGRDAKVSRVRVDDTWQRSTSVGDAAVRETIASTLTVEARPDPLPVQKPIAFYTSLENYRIQSAAVLPDADSEGLRVYKDRQYVDVPDAGVVLVGVDAETGLYRARLSSELLPSGPWMLRDIESGIWHPHNDFSTRTDPLTDASLQNFRSGLDLGSVEPGVDGVIRHNGKLYVVIQEHTYQVLQDLDASRPEYRVWRLVNPADPVATDSANIYRASLGGETVAITRSEQDTWVSILTGLRGGMDRNAPADANPFNFHRPWLTGAGQSTPQPPALVATTRAQVKRYFADSTDQHADDFIARFGEAGVAESELQRIHLEFPQLNREIAAWETGYKGNDDAERSRRLEIGAKMRRLFKWQGDSSEKVYRDGRLVGFELELDLGRRSNLSLPEFSIPLRSVESLVLEGSPSRSLVNMFAMFSHIDSLEVRRFSGESRELLAEIARLPALRVLQMRDSKVWASSIDHELFPHSTRLQKLILTNCSIWPDLSVRGMADLRVLRVRGCALLGLPPGLGDMPAAARLQVLDLFHNPAITDAPDVTHMSELRELNLSYTCIWAPPRGLGSQNGPSRLETLNLSQTPLAQAPSLRGMRSLLEVDLSHTQIKDFPDGVTSENPVVSLDLSYTGITSIPDSVEIRAGFELTGTLLSDPVTFRRLIAARRQTGTDFWLGRTLYDLVIDHWMHNVPQEQHAAKASLWVSLINPTNIPMMRKIRDLVRTPEFQVERSLLQRRVWAFFEHFQRASLGEQETLRDIAFAEPSPGKMLDRLEEEIRKFDPTWQNPPSHHLLKPGRVG